jgi:DNA-binding transcriptional ArsR family regulator
MCGQRHAHHGCRHATQGKIFHDSAGKHISCRFFGCELSIAELIGLTVVPMTHTVNQMVHYNPARLDDVFAALADPTRRSVLARLRFGERSVGTLAAPFGMSLTGFIKHLRILEDAGLIERTKVGRVVSCRLHGGALKEALEWLDRQEEFWNARLDRLGAYLDQQESESWTPQRQPKTPPASTSGASIRNPSPRSTPRGRTRKK